MDSCIVLSTICCSKLVCGPCLLEGRFGPTCLATYLETNPSTCKYGTAIVGCEGCGEAFYTPDRDNEPHKCTICDKLICCWDLHEEFECQRNVCFSTGAGQCSSEVCSDCVWNIGTDVYYEECVCCLCVCPQLKTLMRLLKLFLSVGRS